MSSTENIILKSLDGEFFEVEEAVALEFRPIYRMIEEISIPDNPIPLPNVTGKILSKVTEYCKVHVNADRASSMAGDNLKAWDAEFIKAANYLDIKGLLDLACRTLADMIEGKRPEEIRKTLGMRNDFTPEEEEEVRRVNPWAFQ